MRRLLSKIFSSKLFFIIFSLLAAIALWMYVEITENEMLTETIHNIPIEFSNREILRDRGLLISETQPQELSLTFEAPRNIISQLNNATVSVNINLANITRPAQIFMDYTIIFPAGVNQNAISITDRSVQGVSLTIDRLSARSIPVRVEYTGGTAGEDLIAMPPVFEPQSITVEGPEELLSRIDFIHVPIIVENLETTYVDDLEFYFVDIYGYELSENELDALTTSLDTVRVTIQIRQVKDIPLHVNISHGAGSSDENTLVSITPQFITVSGDPEALRDFNLPPLGVINMTSFTNIATVSMPIILPPQISSESGEQTATVRVDVLNIDWEDFQVDHLFYINAPPGYVVQIIPSHVEVRLRGRTEDLEYITEANIRLVVDLRDLGVGRHRVPARVYIDGIDADVGAVGEYAISIRILPEVT
ncbi:MAG: CdaR family protein [Oscillospiraceae bacterium]|nr:CdaR family protein [Oscillospiraceae bacterium]